MPLACWLRMSPVVRQNNPLTPTQVDSLHSGEYRCPTAASVFKSHLLLGHLLLALLLFSSFWSVLCIGSSLSRYADKCKRLKKLAAEVFWASIFQPLPDKCCLSLPDNEYICYQTEQRPCYKTHWSCVRNLHFVAWSVDLIPLWHCKHFLHI